MEIEERTTTANDASPPPPLVIDDDEEKAELPPRLPPRSPNIAMIVPRGYKLRDEFVCPITRELIVDPVIAADGHTYDRAAIEQWLHGSSRRTPSPHHIRKTSPKTGQPLEHMHLIPNHNLKRLLRDMIKEGGEALYCPDESTSPFELKRGESSLTTTLHEIHPTPKETQKPQESSPTDSSPAPRLALVREMVLSCRCLGPPESDWNGRSFRLPESSSGGSLLGGRRRPHETGNTPDFVQFTDATVSRRHFEIRFLEEERQFALRDLGSAGGTFVRIPPRKGVPLKPGTMIMLGKHQLLAMEPDGRECSEENPEEGNVVSPEENFRTPKYEDVGREQSWRRPLVTTFFPERLEEEMEDDSENDETGSERGSVAENEQGQEQQEHTQNRRSTLNLLLDQDDDSCRSDVLSEEGSKVEENETEIVPSVPAQRYIANPFTLGGCRAVSCLLPSASTIELSPRSHAQTHAEGAPPARRVAPLQTPAMEQQVQLSLNRQPESAAASPNPPPTTERNINTNKIESLLIFRCFAPEGTPIQGKEYPVGRNGATLGRKQGNSISFSHRVCDVSNGSGAGRYSFVGIDSSISGEHATVKYCEENGVLELFDGVHGRCSTNGTWVRLSSMHKQSEWYPLEDKTEILIGTVRFQVTVEEVVVERDIYD